MPIAYAAGPSDGIEVIAIPHNSADSCRPRWMTTLRTTHELIETVLVETMGHAIEQSNPTINGGPDG